jgi:hypothetical protein
MQTVIADAGPLVAYLKRDDKDHDWPRKSFDRYDFAEAHLYRP